MRHALAFLVVTLAIVAVVACNGTTGDQLIGFSAYASGAPGAAQPFPAGNVTIQLTSAKMHIGAVYFDESPPGTGFDGPECIASGTYAAQVPGPVDVDLLSSAPQEFAVYGNGTADLALSWEIWLTDDNVGVDDLNGPNLTPIVQLQGIATDAQGRAASFGAVVTINSANRSKGSSDPAQPGLDPLCKLRVVQIPVDFAFFQGGTLDMTVDPRVWFSQQSDPIQFSPGQLPLVTDAITCNPDTAVVLDPQDYALTPETAPPSSQTCGGSTQACCPVGSGAVLFGGTSNGSTDLGDTWVFDGTWTSASSATSPPPARVDAGVATLAGELVLFGGDGASGAPLNDTWTFDGTSWTQVPIAKPPSARSRPSLAALGTQVVLFGGLGGGGALNDTWTFDVQGASGTSTWASWDEVTVAAAPPARDGASMVALGNELVLFGGSAGGGVSLGDTWTFDGKAWTQATPATSPSPRYGASMAVLDGQAVLFGGFGADGPLADTWTFDGTAWTQLSVATAPSARGDASLAPFGADVVLVGGRGAAGALGDTWKLDGKTWAQVNAPAPPSARYGASMALLPSGQTCLGALTCTSGVCAPTYCIPNSSLLSGEPGTVANDFFTEVISGAPFSVSYAQQ